MLESRIAVIGLIIAAISAVLAWCTHALFLEILTIVFAMVALFGYAYMDK